MSIETLTILFFCSLFLLVLLGLPIAFVLGGLSVLFITFTWGSPAFYMVAAQTWGAMNKFSVVAVPLFILMAMLLERSGTGKDLYEMMYLWFGPVRGGLAVGTVFICALFAAMVGISGAAVISMATIALPSMLGKGYDTRLAVGCINCAGGWGILIPPSVPMILYCLITGDSVGMLYAGGVLAGLFLVVITSAYILIRCWFQPEMGPPIPAAERGNWDKKIKSLKAVILPIMIVVMVLGSIIFGVATATEAASIGVLGAVVSTIVYRQFSWKVLFEASLRTFKMTGMIMWILFGAYCFTAAYQGMGAPDFIRHLLDYIPGGKWGTMIFFQLTLFILGMVLDPNGIMMITLPVFLPLVREFGFDPIWFGVMFIINMEIGYMTPPFGFNLFYMRAIAPPEISMSEIYRSVTPFVLVSLFGLICVMVFPSIATWLPYAVFR